MYTNVYLHTHLYVALANLTVSLNGAVLPINLEKREWFMRQWSADWRNIVNWQILQDTINQSNCLAGKTHRNGNTAQVIYLSSASFHSIADDEKIMCTNVK